jgi:hypothetical protein
MREGATKRRLLLAAGVAAVAALCVAAFLLAGPRTLRLFGYRHAPEGTGRLLVWYAKAVGVAGRR